MREDPKEVAGHERGVRADLAVIPGPDAVDRDDAISPHLPGKPHREIVDRTGVDEKAVRIPRRNRRERHRHRHAGTNRAGQVTPAQRHHLPALQIQRLGAKRKRQAVKIGTGEEVRECGVLHQHPVHIDVAHQRARQPVFPSAEIEPKGAGRRDPLLEGIEVLPGAG